MEPSGDESPKRCYRRLHPMEEPSVTVRVHLDVLEYTRTGLRTREPIDLTTSRDNRVVLERPRLTAPRLTTQFGFALDRAFPLPATLSLLWSYRDENSPLPPFGVPRGGRGVLQIFGHADATGDESHNKSLSERRADVVLALFESNVERMVSLAADDGWTPWEYQVLLRVLGCDPGPTDGDPGELTDLAVAQFGRRYRAGFFHRRGEAPRVAELRERAFDVSTVEALLDAFVHAHAPDLAGVALDATHPSVGCSEFNVVGNGTGALNRRVSLLAGLDSPHPENAPCKQGDANACAVIGGGAGEYGCMWYREHVDAEPPHVPALYDPRWLSVADGSYILSVLTNVPDGAEVTFDVFGHDAPVTTARALPDLEQRWDEPLRAPSIGGVATVRWVPPPEFEAQGASVPVFRVATEANVAHAWANPLEHHGVQLLGPNGRCFSGTALTFDTAAGPQEVSTDADGVAWVRADPESPLSVQVPDDLLLPHPSQRRIVALDQRSATLEAERGAAVELHGGRVLRVRVLPPEALAGYVSCHFDAGSVYPADTILALAKQAQDAVASEPGTCLALFGHARPMSSPEAEKGLSERRARFVHALLTADIDALVAVVEDDEWDESAFVALAHFLGHRGKTPLEVFASFQWGYSAGEHHAPELGVGHADLEPTGALDQGTKRGLLDAFVATAGASLPEDAFAPTPCAGCASFNPPPEGEHPDRVTLVVLSPDRASVRGNLGRVGHRWGTDDHEVHEERHSPFRSQAGGVMGHGIRGGVLVLAKPGRLRTPGYFAYDPSLDKSRGSDVER